MTTSEEHKTLITARLHGGGFIARLAEAALHADPTNRRQVFNAFPQLTTAYGPGTNFYGIHEQR
jgi:hypothetical protein